MTPLAPLPPGFAATVASLHRVAEQLVAAARKPDNEIALEVVPGGWGTPVFEFGGESHRVSVEGAELIHREGESQGQSGRGRERRAPLTSLAAAAVAIDELLPAGADLSSDQLGIDPEASRALAALYGFGDEVLRHLVAEAGPEDAATAPILWPEHFDIAIELGSEAAGRRANYGVSPGDESHPEPYAYVGPWSPRPPGELWNARGFAGAELPYAQLLAAPDPTAAALDFFRARRDALAAPPTEETK